MNNNFAAPLSMAIITAAISNSALAQSDRERIQQLEDKVEALEEQLGATADAVDSAIDAKEDPLSIGGYGELHYNNFEGGDDQIDFHRFVTYFGYEFSDSIRFASELELEHAFIEDESGGDEPADGEVVLEFAYVEFDITDGTRIKGGAFLVPVGILNLTHEPPTFYGVERNRVENRIIPTTWTEGGAELVGPVGDSGFSYNLAIHSGLAVDPADADIREGREKVSEALANDVASTARLQYTGLPGLEVALSAQYQDDISQQDDDGLDEAYLYESHLQWVAGPFGLRALYAMWDIRGAAAEALNRDEQLGYYVEPAFKITPGLGIFARYEELEETEDLTEENATFGANYWPHPQVVLKADYQLRDTEQADGSTVDGDSFNLGIGYLF
jgi:hypothetical protein